ncbi:MAG: 2-amino-4-hydroxy-6-hydroxymethyldihydropteridine diphosphokinase [Clostridia bacterium]|nr:2-amino-4-hydroxy-6-hydroxymethyldihydropteridine diphosphokinase [Clostridia bacterium]
MANYMQAVIGIGSNMGDRLRNINGAVHSISRLPKTRIVDCSHVYETQPVGYEEQATFYNAAITVETELSAAMLLGACLGIEGAFGRVRTVKNGPRVLDLDLLLYEGVKSESFSLTLPHPRILERAFVMVPLLDLFPTGRAPGLFFMPALHEVGTDGVVKIDEEIDLPK